MKKKQQKASKQKRVLVVSILLAALIVAGGTFAWFTSKDEVTNKLTASNNYGVSIVETFTPPSNWTPGQEVNKDVYAINTGNIDAFVRTSISSAMEIVVGGTPETFAAANVEKYVTLDTTEISEGLSEVTALQAGGRLVYQVDSLVTGNDQLVSSAGFVPDDNGLYVFERSLGSDVSQYAGYYYYNDTYYALASLQATTDETTGEITGFSYTLTTKETKSQNDDDLTYDYTNVADADDPYIVVKYGENDDSVIINIHLDKDYTKSWQFDEDTKTFYYLNSLKAGESTEKLIDHLELDENVKNSAYINFEYSLTVTTDSVQVTTDNEGKDSAEAVTWELVPELSLDTDGKIQSITQWKSATP